MEQDEQERFEEDGEPLESVGVVAVAAGVVPGVVGGVQRGVPDGFGSRGLDACQRRRFRRATTTDIKLERAGLAAAVRQPGGRKLLHLTPAGLAMVESVPRTESRSKLITPEHAAGALQRHTLAVNDVGIAFLRAARERGDGFGPLSWRHEIAHPIGSPVGGRRNEQVIADAMLVYEHYEGRSMSFRYRFLELNRNTMPVHALGMKLARYARVFGYRVPSKKVSLGPRFWETRYRVFPTVMLVLDNGTPRQLRHRGENALWFAGTEQDMRDAPKVKVLACLLSDLQAEGPFARIFRGLRDPERPVDWLGRGKTTSTARRTAMASDPGPGVDDLARWQARFSPGCSRCGPRTFWTFVGPWLSSLHHLRSKHESNRAAG